MHLVLAPGANQGLSTAWGGPYLLKLVVDVQGSLSVDAGSCQILLPVKTKVVTCCGYEISTSTSKRILSCCTCLQSLNIYWELWHSPRIPFLENNFFESRMCKSWMPTTRGIEWSRRDFARFLGRAGIFCETKLLFHQFLLFSKFETAFSEIQCKRDFETREIWPKFWETDFLQRPFDTPTTWCHVWCLYCRFVLVQ